MGGVPEWITKTYERPNEAPPEAPEAKAEVASESAPHIEGETSEQRTGYASTVGASGGEEKKGPGKATMRVVGEDAPDLPAEVLAQNEAIARKELNFQEAQAYTRLNAGRAIGQTKAMAQEIFAADAAEMARLNTEHYSRWEQENAQLRQDIDDARALRVNPNNYMQSIGRSGRVASVLSVAVSQLAAGAGEPSSVWKRLKGTIDQDIAAQKANIELEFKGIEAGQGQQKHEAALLEKYYNFEEKSRAVAMYALEAQVAVIQQRAANEGEYQSYQMIRDRAQAEANAAAAAALAKNATLYLDAPTYRAYQALLHAKEWQAAQAMLQEAYMAEHGPVAEIDEAIRTFDAEGNEVIFDTPGAEQAQPLPGEAPGPAPAAPEAAPPAARVSRDRRAAPETTSPGEQAPAPTPSAPLTPEEAQAEREDITEITYPSPLLTPEEQEDFARREKEIEAEGKRRERIGQTTQQVRARMGDERFQAGGHLFYQAKQEGWAHTITDRYTFQEAASILADPQNPEIAVGASYKDARELLHYDYRRGLEAQYEKAHPELYEGYNDTEHEGTKTKPRWVESNWLDTKWGKIKLKGRSLLRADQDKRAELEQTINKDYLRARDLMTQAKAIRKHGLVDIFGVALGPDGPATFTDPGMAKDWMERNSGQIGLGIQAMKQLDPSGRLTDKDIEVGMKFMNALANSTPAKAWELATSVYNAIFGDGAQEGGVRKSIEKCLGAMAGKLSLALRDAHHHDIVINYDQAQFADAERAEVYKWLGSSDKEIEASEKNHHNQLMDED